MSAAPEGTAVCRHCGRHFNTDRLGKHEAVCQRMMSNKRKIFDASKQRIEGTEAEKYNKKPKGTRTRTTYSSAAQQKGLTTGVKKNNWRKKHEEFIQSIRAAKQVQAHLARGGKLSDSPPVIRKVSTIKVARYCHSHAKLFPNKYFMSFDPV